MLNRMGSPKNEALVMVAVTVEPATAQPTPVPLQVTLPIPKLVGTSTTTLCTAVLNLVGCVRLRLKLVASPYAKFEKENVLTRTGEGAVLTISAPVWEENTNERLEV